MPKKFKQSYDFFALYERFIKDSKAGRRLQPNGKRISAGTVRNYYFTSLLLRRFCKERQFNLCIHSSRYLTKRELSVEKKYWKKFYKYFTDYLYDELGYFDNYVGLTIKNIRTFFNFVNKDLALNAGEFYKFFYVRKEEIAIFPLMPEELNYLIHDKLFESGLSQRMKEVKDFMVFGCTVALRFSDLISLQKSNLRQINGQYYLAVRSKKTNTDTFIKLPSYAIEIIQRYHKLKKSLLPRFNNVNLNLFIKRLLEQAGFTHSVQVARSKRGVPVQLVDGNKAVRFCDVATTHTMRRTAITTMLSLGVPEQLVRKISGHSPSGKEFYRYVLLAQAYQDKEMSKMFDQLNEKVLEKV